MITDKKPTINISLEPVFEKKPDQNILHAFGIFCFVFIILFTFPASLFSQNQSKIDSLTLSVSYSTSNDKTLSTLIELASQLQDNDPKQALEYAIKALAMSKKIDDKHSEVVILNKIAILYWNITNYKLAMEYATTALTEAKKHTYTSELAISNRTIGLVYTDLGSYKKASEHFFVSLKLSEEVENQESTAKALSSIGYVYFDQDNYDKALEYYFRSLNLSKTIKYPKGIARGLNNIAAVYGSQEEYEKANKYITEAIEINKSLGNLHWVGINYMNLGLTNQMLGNPKNALQYYNQAIEIFNNLNNTIWELKCSLNIGNFYFGVGDFSKSLEYGVMVLEQAQAHKMKRIEYDSYSLFNKTYLALGDTISAYKYTLLQIQAKDSLDIKKNKVQLSKLELQYEFEKKTQDELIENQRYNFAVSIVILILIFALILIFLLWTRLKIKTKNTKLKNQVLEEQLEYKNKEFIMHMMSLMKKNEIIENIGEKLYRVEKTAVKDETKDALNKIAAELQKSTDSEIWEEFELRFKQVHSGFYSALHKHHPNLTPNEQKLCAFLHLNMSTKEISELTGQSVSTLETARYRLRKKLNISDPKTNLVSFLSEIQ